MVQGLEDEGGGAGGGGGVLAGDQATVGDLQAGVAWTTGEGAQMSFGLVERQLRFNDIGGDRDIDRKERFAAFSYTLHH